MNLNSVKKIGWNILVILIFFMVCSFIPKNYFVYTIGMCVGTIATIGCGYVLRKYYHAKKYWVSKRATVVSVDEDRSYTWAGNPGIDIYNPVIQFVTDDGEKMTVRSNEGSSLSDYPEGTWIDIYYDPADPKKIMMDDGYTVGVCFLFFVGGLALIIVFNILIVIHPEYLR